MKQTLRLVWQVQQRHIMSDVHHNVIEPLTKMIAGVIMYGLGALAVRLIEPHGSVLLSYLLLFFAVVALAGIVYGIWWMWVLVSRCLPSTPFK